MNEAFTQDIKAFIHCTHGVQQEFFKQELENLREVQCVPLADVLTEEEISRIERYVQPKKKQCYRNAATFVQEFFKEATYVEGRVLVCGYPIDHAFVKIRNCYVDPTLELCCGDDVTKNSYVAFFETDVSMMSQLIINQGCYGNLFGAHFAESKLCKISK